MIGALLLLAVTVVPAGEEFTCTPTRVWDGDGPVWCAEGPRIRLAGNLQIGFLAYLRADVDFAQPNAFTKIIGIKP